MDANVCWWKNTQAIILVAFSTQVVAERLEALQRKVQSLINAELGKCSADITGDDEAALANLMSVNDELQLCVKSYRRMAPKAEVNDARAILLANNSQNNSGGGDCGGTICSTEVLSCNSDTHAGDASC
ncbi:unnamed protein product [Dibothriocephalus latus]|uniref:GAT domain-containing protein n=1 Tax=Dibothriocephalus latus TaxID=60516 RepID=A0A3P7LY38_DIBLA|nr:unnamed protein product [Dibothriocephalus latus]